MKVRIIEQPTGLLNGAYWPAEGEVCDLPDAVAEVMIDAGHVEQVKAAKKAAPAKKAEKRPASAAKVEKRDRKS